MDGGGSRAIVSLAMLHEIMPRDVTEPAHVFDMIAGTSSGGVSAFAFGILNKSVDGMLEVFRKPSLVFKPFLTWLWPIRGYMYNPMHLAQLVRDIAKDIVMIPQREDCSDTPYVFAVATRKGSPNQRTLLANYSLESSPYTRQTRMSIVDACLATSAAPMYFPPVKVHGTHDVYIDGGVGTNSPAFIALQEAELIWPTAKIVVVSLGNGSRVPRVPNAAWLAPMKIVSYLTEAATTTNDTHELMMYLDHVKAEMVAYFRLNPVNTPNTTLDETDERVISKLEWVARRSVETSTDRIRWLLKAHLIKRAVCRMAHE